MPNPNGGPPRSQLHSRFDPHKEAVRFLDRELGTESVHTAILVAPGLNYLSAALLDRSADIKLVCLFASSQSFADAVRRPALSWHPALGGSAESFLRDVLREEDLLQLRLLVWPPAEQRYPDMTAELLSKAAEALAALSATFATAAASGKRWIRNAAFHSRCVAPGDPNPRLERPRRGRHPVVVAAAGPTLEQGIEGLRRRRDELELWALPSALLPLAQRGIFPDLVVTSDSGFYARSHLRRAYLEPIPCAAPVTAARNLSRLRGPLLLLSNQTPLEQTLLDLGEVPSVPENGTVAGIALDLALSLGRYPVVFLGLDGCSRDVVTHARPSELDPFVVQRCSRLRPEETARWERVASAERFGDTAPPCRISPSLSAYAAWFRRRCSGLGDGVLRVNPTDVDYGMPEVSIDEIPPLPEEVKGGPAFSEPSSPPGNPRGIDKLVDRLLVLTGEGLEDLIGKEVEARLNGDPRGAEADLLYLCAPRAFARAVVSPSHDNAAGVRNEVAELAERLLRYKEVSP